MGDEHRMALISSFSIIVSAAFVSISLIGCTLIRGEPDGEEAMLPPALQSADADRDRNVTLEEWDDRSEVLFDMLDLDADGFIEVDELKDQFDTLDRDADKAIEPEEARSIVRRGDLNGDGRVSREEFAVIDWSTLISDSNQDGKVSRKEFERARREMFMDVDRDRDSLVEWPELDESSRITIFRF